MAGKRMPSRNLRFRSRGKPTTMRCARNSQSPAESGCRRDAAAIDPSISGTAGRLTSAISALAFFWHSNLQLLLSRAFCPSASFHVLSLIFPSSWPFAAVYRAHHNLLKRKIAGDRALCQRFLAARGEAHCDAAGKVSTCILLLRGISKRLLLAAARRIDDKDRRTRRRLGQSHRLRPSLWSAGSIARVSKVRCTRGRGGELSFPYNARASLV
jgi:hypothetical protein